MLFWSVLRALNSKKKNPQRIDKELKEKEDSLNMEGIEYPVSLKDITKLKNQNPTISVTVLGYNDREKVHPLRNSEYVFDRKHVVVLMLIEKDGVKHYFLVKSLSRLLSTEVSKHKENERFCLRCLNPFWDKKAFNKHIGYCKEHESVRITMPNEKYKIISSKNHYRQELVPFVVYADFEFNNKPIEDLLQTVSETCAIRFLLLYSISLRRGL